MDLIDKDNFWLFYMLVVAIGFFVLGMTPIGVALSIYFAFMLIKNCIEGK